MCTYEDRRTIRQNLMKSVKEKKKRRKQAIVGMMDKDSHISVETIAEKLERIY